MSVFRVKLNNMNQGQLDMNPATGAQFTTSIQRSIFVMGPGKSQRLLKDGDTFTDSNYWKRFSYPNVPLSEAFIEVVTDDGSVYNDADGNGGNYPVTWLPGAAADGIIVAGDTYDDTNMALDVVATYGGAAAFVLIENTDNANPVKVRLNGSTSAILTVAEASTKVFDNGDLVISKIEFDNSASGASSVNKVQVILGIRSVNNS